MQKNFSLFLQDCHAILELFGILTFIITTFYFLRVDDDTAKVISELSIFGFAILRLIPVFSLLVANASEIKYYQKSFFKISDEIITFRKEHKNLNLSSFKSPLKKETLNKIDTIELRNIDFKYDNSTKLVLDNLSVSFANNQITGIMGPSGSGKSTLISIVLGLLKPQNGKIIFKSNGEDISKTYQIIFLVMY